MDVGALEKLTEWSEPREVNTRYGARLLRTGAITPEASELWRSPKKAELQNLGLGMSKTREGEWQLAWWQPLPETAKEARAEAREMSRASTADVALRVPDGLTYLPYQKAGIALALRWESMLLADEMGLGKTIQAIGVINNDASIKRVLVVCPASLRLNWRRELERWLVEPRSIALWTTKEQSPADIIIVNYDILGKLTGKLRVAPFDLMIVDEAHYCKNPKAQRTKALFGTRQTKLAAPSPGVPARRTLLMTGTPIVNRPAELLPLLESLGGEVMRRVGGSWRYLQRYCNAHRKNAGGRLVWDFTGASHLEELQAILRETCMVRRLKAEVLTELPPKQRQVIELESAGLESIIERERLAVAQQEERIDALREAVELSKAEDNYEAWVEAVENLRQGMQALFTEISKQRHATALAKIPQVIAHVREALEDDAGHKVVVMAHHRDVQDALYAEFGELATLHRGGMPDVEKQAAVDRFQSDATCQVFIGSILASGVGITLTASSHVVFAELDWVPGNMTQAEDRCHRIGQHDNVLVQHLVLDGSLDATMAKTLVRKQAVIDAALDDEIAELQAEPLPLYSEPATGSVSRKKVAEESQGLTIAQIAAIHEAMQCLAAACDGARKNDMAGFNRIDARVGKSLAMAAYLTPKQAALGLRIARRYHKTQLGQELWQRCQG